MYEYDAKYDATKIDSDSAYCSALSTRSVICATLLQVFLSVLYHAHSFMQLFHNVSWSVG